MRLHFPSVAVGVVAVSLVLVSMSQGPVDSSSPPRVEYGPHPRDMVQISEGTSYVVPAGKIFVLTAMGTNLGGNCLLQLNGQTTELNTYAANGDVGISVRAVPTGFTAPAGSSLVVFSQSNPGSGRAWGYLSKQ